MFRNMRLTTLMVAALVFVVGIAVISAGPASAQCNARCWQENCPGYFWMTCSCAGAEQCVSNCGGYQCTSVCAVYCPDGPPPGQDCGGGGSCSNKGCGAGDCGCADTVCPAYGCPGAPGVPGGNGSVPCASRFGCNGPGCNCTRICPKDGTAPCGGLKQCPDDGCKADDCVCADYCASVSYPCNGAGTCSSGGCKGLACDCDGEVCSYSPPPCGGAGGCFDIGCDGSNCDINSTNGFSGCPGAYCSAAVQGEGIHILPCEGILGCTCGKTGCWPYGTKSGPSPHPGKGSDCSQSQPCSNMLPFCYDPAQSGEHNCCGCDTLGRCCKGASCGNVPNTSDCMTCCVGGMCGSGTGVNQNYCGPSGPDCNCSVNSPGCCAPGNHGCYRCSCTGCPRCQSLGTSSCAASPGSGDEWSYVRCFCQPAGNCGEAYCQNS